MSYLIKLIRIAEDDSFTPRIGGSALLPEDLAWPCNPDGAPLVLLASLPAIFLNNQKGLNLPLDYFVSVFSTYDKADYFLDSVTCQTEEASSKEGSASYTKVLVHQKGAPRNESTYVIPAREIDLLAAAETSSAEYTGSKLSGQPAWLQRGKMNLQDYDFIMQLYSSDFPPGFEDIFYLTDAVGYLFLRKDMNGGWFFVQTT